jgi:hypothetical protein
LGSHFKTVSRTLFILGCASGVLLFQNCDSYYSVGQRSGESIAGFSLDSKAQTILSQNCYACHTDTQNAGGVSHLDNTNLMVDDGTIVPGDTNLSPLINALESSSIPEHALSDLSMSILRDWVASLSDRFSPPDVTQPPTCTLTVDKNAILLGEAVTATLQVTGKALSARIHGLPVRPQGDARMISPTATDTIKAQVSNEAGTTLCQSASVVVTTTPVDPGSLVPRCALLPSTTSAVPGDAVTLELSITAMATSASINSVAVPIPGGGVFPSVVVNPVSQTTYSARVNGGGSFSTCSTVVSTKTTAQMTKEEYFRAKIGASGLSVNDLLIRGRRASGATYGGSCIHCHTNNSVPSTQSRARLFFVLVSNDPTLNFNAIKNITHPTDATRTWDLTVSPQSLYNYVSGHRASALSSSYSGLAYRYRPEELTQIQTFVNKP